MHNLGLLFAKMRANNALFGEMHLSIIGRNCMLRIDFFSLAAC